MVVKVYKNVIASLLLALVLWGMAAGTANATFSFRGYTYNETNVTLNNTNVSIEAYTFGPTGPQLMGTDYNSSDATGFFNVSVTNDNEAYFYRIVIKHFANNQTSGTLDYIGPSLPQFPRMMVAFLTMAPASPMNFYLRRGGTINFNATNGTGGTGANQNFMYMIKDQRLGFPIAENFNAEQGNVTVHVPRERNYSIMIFPNQSLPIYYNLNNLTDYASTNYTVNITFDTRVNFKWVSGYANLSDGTTGFENLNVIAYLMEPGDMLAKKHPMPENMAAWQPGGGWPNTFNNATGFFNITLPGSAQGAGVSLMLFATAKLNATAYYGAFRNITINYTQSNVTNFNFSLAPLLGNVGNITLDSSTGGRINVTTKLLPFQLINGTDGTNITQQNGHIEMEVNYSTACTNCSHFKWMADVDNNENGSFSIPALNADIRKINVFLQNFAPLKTSKNTTQLATLPVNITMKSAMDNEKPDGSEFSDNIFIDMLLSKPECDRPEPASGCSLIPESATQGGKVEGEFDPFKTVLGGGKISLRIKNIAKRITVHYKNVDMLASPPPDALFDDSATSSQSGSSLEQAWRFGSKGPEIYDEVLIGVPISSSLSVSGVKIGKLYDENWGTSWDISTNNTAQIPSDYSTFNSTWFATGFSCSTTDNSSNCYINTTEGTLWLKIPHFSGVGPTISGTTSTGGGGSSGSTGGAGVVSSESFANIAKAERYDKSLIANTPVTYTFKAPEHGIFEIAVTGKENENDIAIRVEALKGLSKSVSAPPEGVVYKHLNIIAGTTRIKEAVIKFKVENSWLADNNLAGGEVKLMRWDGSKWNQLETAEKNKDASFTFYEAKTTGFSSFAITGVKAAAPTAAPTEAAVTATPAETSTAAPTVPAKKGMPGFEATIAVVVITLLAASLVNDRKRR